MRILFVCLGNICRSPSAEAAVRSRAPAGWELDSAGTSAHSGMAPYGPMQAAARKRGLDMSALRGRQVERADFDRFDLILAMDAQNRADLERLRGTRGGARVRLFTEFAPASGATHVPDPYYTRDFDGALALIEQCAEGLVAELAPR